MASRRTLVRSNQWWDHKVPPVIGVAAVAIGLGPGSAGVDELVDLVLVLVSVVGVAAFGHLVNDWADVDADARGGKANALAERSVRARLGLVAASGAVGLLPWIWLPRREVALVALGVEVLSLVAYSVPPVRLKARGAWGALADAGYAYAIPFVLVSALFAPAGLDRAGLALALVALWGMGMGLRGILWHQLEDLDADRAAGVETLAARVGPSRAEALAASFLLPVELGAALGLVWILDVAWLPWLLVGFGIWRSFQVLLLWVPPLDLRGLAQREARVKIIGFEFANEFVERWLPLGALVALAAGSWWWWLATAVYVVAFANGARSFLGHDLWLVPDAIERVAFSRGITAAVRDAERDRLARVAAGAPAGAQRPDRRFVFVVCGPASHLLTLRTAVHHLRPITDTELWVITDSRRNEQVVDIEGVDRIVDVATPTNLDDHQASIWLKTSVHRHLPTGEWCYLDSDIIARVPGVEEVFSQRRGPVAFASDLTIRENSVDRFSPWAMTCSCLGYGDEHSCSHLRDQLAQRFDLDVPGDWLHWNGGVFLFGADSTEFLDLWHERAVASFDWPEWKTRDQGALIATVWTLGLADLPRISPEFNFIADLGNGDLCLDLERGWAHHPSGPWYDAKLLHLYTSPLEDPQWGLGPDVEAVVLRRSRLRVHRYERSEVKAKAKGLAINSANDVRWGVQTRAEVLAHKARRLNRRMSPRRVRRGVRSRLGLDVSHLPIPGVDDARETGPTEPVR